jgi:hypothetical protein
VGSGCVAPAILQLHPKKKSPDRKLGETQSRFYLGGKGINILLLPKFEALLLAHIPFEEALLLGLTARISSLHQLRYPSLHSFWRSPITRSYSPYLITTPNIDVLTHIPSEEALLLGLTARISSLHQLRYPSSHSFWRRYKILFRFSDRNCVCISSFRHVCCTLWQISPVLSFSRTIIARISDETYKLWRSPLSNFLVFSFFIFLKHELNHIYRFVTMV